MADLESNFFSSLLDDYYAECDEHLTRVRSALLRIESFVDQPVADLCLLEELLRSFHTIKGLSGMVGLEAAEKLSHDIESLVRSLLGQRVVLTHARMDALMGAAKTLDQVIGAHRLRQEIPDAAPASAGLQALAANTPSTPAAEPTSVCPPAPASPAFSAEEQAKLASAMAEGLTAYHCHFVPDQELARQGINVNFVRRHLQELGLLIQAVPEVSTEGKISFLFLIATRVSEETLRPLLEMGVRCTPCETAQPADRDNSENSREASPDVAATTTVPGVEPPAGAAGIIPALAATNMVRVDLAKLDALMRMVGELVISRARLADGLKRLQPTMSSSEWGHLQQVNLAMERQLRDLREGVMRVRMVPIGEVFERMRFVVHDLAREMGIKIELEVVGAETEIDKFIVERMLDPLLHLVRNAVSHGFESDEERHAHGKPPAPKVALRAATSGDMVLIEIADDGRGLDFPAIAERARSLRLMGAEEALEPSRLLEIISHPGFSTRDHADRASGRGIGMTVVANAVKELGGTLTLTSQPHAGACFTIELPLTLAILDALIVTVADQVFAVPLTAVREVIAIDDQDVTLLENNEILSYRNGVLPLIRLWRLFKLPHRATQRHCALVVGEGAGFSGLVVDRILGQREIVVRALADPLVQIRGLSGATELGDGRVVLIVDVAALIRSVRQR